MKKATVALALVTAMATALLANGATGNDSWQNGNNSVGVTASAKSASKLAAKTRVLRFSAATKKLAKTPAKATLGKSFSLKLGIESSAKLKKVTAKNLPTGLSINSKTGKISGTPKKSGEFTATVTVQDAAGKKITQKVKIRVYVPSKVKGTYYGYTCRWNSEDEVYEMCRDSREVKVTISSVGKVSETVGTHSYSGGRLKFRNGLYVFDTAKSGVASFKIDPKASWTEDSLTGTFYEIACVEGDCTAENEDTQVFARKNATETIDAAKKIAAKCAELGAQAMGVEKSKSKSDGYDYSLTCQKCSEDPDYFRGLEKVYIKTDKNGKATFSGSIGGTSVNGTAYLQYHDDDGRAAHACFFIGRFVVEVAYWKADYRYSTPLDGNTMGYAWRKK